VSTTIAVVTALRLETRAVLGALTRPRRIRPAERPSWTGRAGEHEIVVVEGGVGPVAAARAVKALPTSIALVGSLGFAGGLDPALATGDVIVPSTIVWEEAGVARRYDVAPALVESLGSVLAPALGRPPQLGTLFSAGAVVADVAAKRAAYERHAAAGVEMEAAALARYARDHGVALFALRVVLDPAALSLEQLPPNLDASWAARARLATMPWVWPLLATLRRHAATAASVLTHAARAALPALPLT
jgi:adenosylhomocysteine nucleosidase